LSRRVLDALAQQGQIRADLKQRAEMFSAAYDGQLSRIVTLVTGPARVGSLSI